MADLNTDLRLRVVQLLPPRSPPVMFENTSTLLTGTQHDTYRNRNGT